MLKLCHKRNILNFAALLIFMPMMMMPVLTKGKKLNAKWFVLFVCF
jgi:hypothetical protein